MLSVPEKLAILADAAKYDVSCASSGAPKRDSRSGGLGWYIFEARSELETAKVFAGLFTVIVIGLLVESVVFRAIESRTVVRWGMQR